MSCGCLIVASDSPPVREVVNSANGILFPFFASDRLADHVINALAHPGRYAALRAQARQDAVQNFDMRRKCVPEFLKLLGREPAKSWLPGDGKTGE